MPKNIYRIKKCFSAKRKRRRSDLVLWQKPLYQQKIRKPMDKTKTPPKTSITQRLRTVSWSSNNHPTGVVILVYGYPTFPLTTKAVSSKGQTFKGTWKRLGTMFVYKNYLIWNFNRILTESHPKMCKPFWKGLNNKQNWNHSQKSLFVNIVTSHFVYKHCVI